jgi:hypothetical protein
MRLQVLAVLLSAAQAAPISHVKDRAASTGAASRRQFHKQMHICALLQKR